MEIMTSSILIKINLYLLSTKTQARWHTLDAQPKIKYKGGTNKYFSILLVQKQPVEK